ncbi:PREDICTED: protein IMPACT isoform X2 [Hipposideros armiger]|uniref:Protein IMPACT n=1 Tax=Hipposideros armiger TaxID=186990 RepID=A0A8B7SEI1_HIPAR|nr:PREDICTED: protein IMPACT isoform X2 [Hipposideros armiger]
MRAARRSRGCGSGSGSAAACASFAAAAPRPRAPDLSRQWPPGRSQGHMAEGDAGSDQRQNEEIEAMAAIYGEEWCVIDDCAKIFCIRISDDIDDPKWTLCLQVMLPNEYPGTAPPIYQLNAPWLTGQERADLSNSLEEIYIENIGESILYLWVEKIRDVLIQKSQMTEPDVKKKTEEEDVECEEDIILACQPENPVKALGFDISENRTEIEELPPIDHGIPITDRRSTFQAHLAPVVCPKQVKMVLAKLYENKKIASATHNIYAYRIYCEDKQTFLQDCEDDGETAAGGRLLHLMEILNVRNVMVVVSRWYGGILLGPDRFKHINNCARNILVEKNYTNSPEESSKALGKNKKVRKDKKRSEH